MWSSVRGARASTLAGAGWHRGVSAPAGGAAASRARRGVLARVTRGARGDPATGAVGALARLIGCRGSGLRAGDRRKMGVRFRRLEPDTLHVWRVVHWTHSSLKGNLESSVCVDSGDRARRRGGKGSATSSASCRVAGRLQKHPVGSGRVEAPPTREPGARRKPLRLSSVKRLRPQRELSRSTGGSGGGRDHVRLIQRRASARRTLPRRGHGVAARQRLTRAGASEAEFRGRVPGIVEMSVFDHWSLAHDHFITSCPRDCGQHVVQVGCLRRCSAFRNEGPANSWDAGRCLPTSRRSRSTFGQIQADWGRTRPNSGQTCPEFGQNRLQLANLARVRPNWANWGRNQPKPANICPDLTDIGTGSAKFGPTSTTLARSPGTKVGPNRTQIGPKSAQVNQNWPITVLKLARFRPNLDRNRTSLARNRPKLTERWNDNDLGTLIEQSSAVYVLLLMGGLEWSALCGASSSAWLDTSSSSTE